MSFKCDGILKIDGKHYIFEYKTESMFKFNKRTEIAEEHKNQAQCYSLAFNIDKVLFVYENRDFCNKKAFLYRVNGLDIQSIRNKILKCEEFRTLKRIPPKEIHKGCQYCNYKRTCATDR